MRPIPQASFPPIRAALGGDSASRPTWAPFLLIRFLDCVAAKFVSHDRQHAIGEIVVLAGPNPANQGFRDDGSGDVQIDCLEYRPAALPGVGDVGFQAVELRIFLSASAVRSSNQERTTLP